MLNEILIVDATGSFALSPGAPLPWRVGSGNEVASRLQLWEPLVVLAVTVPGCSDDDVALMNGGDVALGLTMVGQSAFLTWMVRREGQEPFVFETPFHSGLEQDGAARFLAADADGNVRQANLVIVLGDEHGICRAVRHVQASDRCSFLLAELVG